MKGMIFILVIWIMFGIEPKANRIEERVYAIEKRLKSEGDLREYPQGSQGRQATETGCNHCSI